MNHLEELHLGYVKILSGVSAGRIGRYTCNDADTGKAKVYFGYQSDYLRFQNYRNCKKVAMSNLTNHIIKENLIDRYYFVSQELNSIDLNSHKKIKKYTSAHTDLITECNLIHALLREAFSLQHLSSLHREQNVLLHFSFLDMLWAQDVSLNLEEAGFHIAWNDHEVWYPEENQSNRFVEICGAHILVSSKNTVHETWLHEDALKLVQTISADGVKIFYVKSDAAPVPSNLKDYYDLQNPMSDEYYRSLQRLTTALAI